MESDAAARARHFGENTNRAENYHVRLRALVTFALHCEDHGREVVTVEVESTVFGSGPSFRCGVSPSVAL
jgi:hypothetical protein